MEGELRQVEDENLLPREWVYMGQRVHKGKRIYAWKTLHNDKTGYYPKPLVTASVGSVYIFHEGEDGRTFRSSGQHAPRFIRKHDNEEEILFWAAQDEAVKQELSVKAMNTKAAKVEPLADLYESIRRIAVPLNATERRALLSRIAEELFTAK